MRHLLKHGYNRLVAGFNPLVIGSIFQTRYVFDFDECTPVKGFNPLVIGSIFQTYFELQGEH